MALSGPSGGYEGVPAETAGWALAHSTIRCDSCGAQRSLRGIASHGSLAPLNLRCLGLQPWQAGAANECSEDPQVVQRGATNVYFGHTHHAMSNYEQGGIFFHNPGAPIRGLDFRVLPVELEAAA